MAYLVNLPYVLLILLVLLGVSPASAGPKGSSLEVCLQKAKYVVVGQITQIEEKGVRQGYPDVDWAMATVTVKEVLKGDPPKTVRFLVVTRVGPGWLGSAALQTRRIGDSGIWFIGPDGRVAPNMHLFHEEHAADIRRILNPFGEKGWSEPVDGLRIWAGAFPWDVPRACWYGDVVLVVHNVSRADIFLPLPRLAPQTALPPEPGFLWATAKGRDGRNRVLFLDDGHSRSEAAPCVKLSPCKAIHLPNAYGVFLDPKQQLSSERYSVVVTYRNEQAEGRAKDEAGNAVRVGAWTGELKTPPVEFVSRPRPRPVVTPRR